MNNEKNIRMSNSQFEIITESNVKINGDTANRLPGNANISFKGVKFFFIKARL